MARSSITKNDLLTGRVGLVIQGGGAKGAYQVGVWKALWRAGIRRFAIVSGTSVGALNAVLLSSAGPAEVERIWNQLIAEGILHRRGRLVLQVVAILFGYLLVFAPSLATFLWAFWFADRPGVSNPYYAWSGIMLVTTGLVMRRDADLLLQGMEHGLILGFVVRHVQAYRRISRFAWQLGLLTIVIALMSGSFEVSRLGAVTAVALYLGSFWLMNFGRRIAHRKFVDDPLFSREPLQREINSRSAARDFPNCSGPILATLGRLCSFDNPFSVDPREPDPQSELGSSLGGPLLPAAQWRYHRRARVTQWVPFYVDLKGPGDTAWVLEASSAIPFVFSAVIQPPEHQFERRLIYVDGGIADNMPLTPLLAGERLDVILALGCNYGDQLPSQAAVEKIWRSYWLSSEEDSGKVDEVRTQLREHPEAEPLLSPSLAGQNIVLLKPSRHIVKRCGVPAIDAILDLVTGTLRFDRDYARELIELGERDTRNWLDELDRQSLMETG